MSVMSIARQALAQRRALRTARRRFHLRRLRSTGASGSPLVWACGLMLIAIAAAWD